MKRNCSCDNVCELAPEQLRDEQLVCRLGSLKPAPPERAPQPFYGGGQYVPKDDAERAPQDVYDPERATITAERAPQPECPSCHGSGAVTGQGHVAECGACGGSGQAPQPELRQDEIEARWLWRCPECRWVGLNEDGHCRQFDEHPDGPRIPLEAVRYVPAEPRQDEQ